MARNLNLDVDAPDKVVLVLRHAADSFYESSSELESAWQDPGAGKPWEIIAKELEACADRIGKKLTKIGW